MSAIHDPGKRPPDSEPQGLVEEIKEEIGHVVERVPAPVRWTARKLALLVAAALVALVVVAVVSALLYFANRTELVARELVLFVNGTLAQRTDVTLDFADIRGNPLRQVTLIEPRVRFRDGLGPPLLEAPEIRLRYSAWGLATGRARAVEIDLVRPIVRLGRRADGRLRLPLWKASGRPPRPRSGFDVRVRIRGGALDAPPPLSDLEGVELAAAVGIGAGTHAVVENLSWKRGFYETRDLRLSGEITAGDSVRFVVRRLDTPDFRLRAHGGWRKDERLRSVHAEVERLRWRWLAQVTGNRTLEVPGEGDIVVDARGDTAWRGTFRSDLTWNGARASGGGGFVWADRRLAVRPLAARTDAGELRGALGWSKQGWHVEGRVTDSNPVSWKALGIPGWPEGNLDGELRYVVDTRGAPDAHLSARLDASTLAGWTADRAVVEVDFPAVGPDSFSVVMERRGGTVTLAGASAAGGWTGVYQARELPLEEWPDGRKSGISGMLERAQGTVRGVDGRLIVTGDLEGRSTRWLGAAIERWRLPDASGVLLPAPDLETSAALGRMEFLGIRFDSTAMSLRLLDRAAELTAVRARAGDTTITLAGRTLWNEGGWRMTLDRAAARSDQFDWVAEPPVRLAGDRAGVVFDRLAARDRASRLEVAGRWAVPGGHYDWSLRGDALDLSRLGMPPALGLAGTLDARLEVRGPSGDPRWTFEGEFSDPGLEGHRADTLSLALAGSRGVLEVRRAALGLEGGALTAQGAFTGMTPLWPRTLDVAGVEAWLAAAGRWEGEVGARDLALERLERLAPRARGWAGELSGRLAVSGSPARPSLQASLEAKPLAWEGYRVDSASAEIAYRPHRLEVRELRLARGSLVSTARGEMPLELAAGRRPVVPEAPMAWRVEIPNGDLAVLPVFVPQFGSAAGRFEMSARIAGTPRHPELEGYLRVRDGELRMAGREEVIHHVSADFRLDESRITLDTLSARQGERGRVAARGGVELGNAGIRGYAFDVQMREFTALETGLYAAQFDGDFRVTDGPRIRRQIVPHVEGRAEIRRAVIFFDFANQTEMQKIAATTQPLFWTYRIQVDATNNLRWQPPDGDIEFNANLSLEQTPDELIIYGEMHALRGTYWFLSNRFTVSRADLTFDNVEGVNPVLDAEATTRVRPTRIVNAGLASSGDVVPHEITVRIQGRANEPVIEFSSVPADLDESEILRELTLVNPLQEGGAAALGDPVDNYLTRAINKTLSAEMSRVFQGYVNEWELERERGGLWGSGDVYLSVGSQITPQLLLRYRQRLGLGGQSGSTTTGLPANPFERDFEAEFRINRLIYVTSEIAQRRALGGSSAATTSGPDFNLNLKARWEY